MKKNKHLRHFYLDKKYSNDDQDPFWVKYIEPLQYEQWILSLNLSKNWCRKPFCREKKFGGGAFALYLLLRLYLAIEDQPGKGESVPVPANGVFDTRNRGPQHLGGQRVSILLGATNPLAHHARSHHRVEASQVLHENSKREIGVSWLHASLCVSGFLFFVLFVSPFFM